MDSSIRSGILSLNQAAQLRTIAESVQDLLTTAAVDPKLSLNIPFLTHLFEKRQNIDVLLCRSSLFDWVRSESWGSEANRRFVRGIAAMIQDTDGHDPENGAVNESLPGQSVEHRNGPLNVDALGLDNPTSAIAEPRHLNHVFLNRFAPGENYPANRPSYNVPKNSPELVRDSSVHQVFFNRQLCAKLHCLYGVPISSVQKDSDASIRYTLRRETVPIHSYARSLVYDLRQHTEDGTFWGPFLDDGLQTVDWEKMEAVMIMLDFNLRRFTQAHRQLQGLANLPDKPFIGATPYSFISPPQSAIMEPSVPLEAQDPYNITGTWMRIVCFLDYQELYAFNFSSDEPEQGQPRKPIDTEEATRLINMIIRVTKIEPPGENDGKGLPVVHFAGKSSAITPLYDPNANSKIKGRTFSPLHIRYATDVV